MAKKSRSILGLENPKDFYFSQAHKEYQMGITGLYSFSDGRPLTYTPKYFKGREYTEVIDAGATPLSNHFGDLVFLGTGTYADISFKPQQVFNNG